MRKPTRHFRNLVHKHSFADRARRRRDRKGQFTSANVLIGTAPVAQLLTIPRAFGGHDWPLSFLSQSLDL
jgi:hypothetical protein